MKKECSERVSKMQILIILALFVFGVILQFVLGENE